MHSIVTKYCFLVSSKKLKYSYQKCRLVKSTRYFTKNNTNILFTKEEKGNRAVAIEKKEYFNKIKKLLADVDTYTMTDKNPTKRLTEKMPELSTK